MLQSLFILGTSSCAIVAKSLSLVANSIMVMIYLSLIGDDLDFVARLIAFSILIVIFSVSMSRITKKNEKKKKTKIKQLLENFQIKYKKKILIINNYNLTLLYICLFATLSI